MPDGLPPPGGVPPIHDHTVFPHLPTSKLPQSTKSSEPKKPSYAESIRSQPFVNAALLPKLPELNIIPPTITTKDGLKAILFQENEVEESKQAYKYALVARFHGERPSVDKFDLHVNTQWGLESLAVVGLLNPRHILIRLDNETDFRRAWAREDCSFNHTRFSLFKWTEDLKDTKRAIWIELQKLPVQFQLPTFLEQIGNNIGKFLGLDERTRRGKHPIAPRMCVEFDMTIPLPPAIWVGYISKDGSHNGFQQEITYDFNKARCALCKSFGHETILCPDQKVPPKLSFKKSSSSFIYNPPMPFKRVWVPKFAKPASIPVSSLEKQLNGEQKTNEDLIISLADSNGHEMAPNSCTPSPPSNKRTGDHLYSNKEPLTELCISNMANIDIPTPDFGGHLFPTLDHPICHSPTHVIHGPPKETHKTNQPAIPISLKQVGKDFLNPNCMDHTTNKLSKTFDKQLAVFSLSNVAHISHKEKQKEPDPYSLVSVPYFTSSGTNYSNPCPPSLILSDGQQKDNMGTTLMDHFDNPNKEPVSDLSLVNVAKESNFEGSKEATKDENKHSFDHSVPKLNGNLNHIPLVPSPQLCVNSLSGAMAGLGGNSTPFSQVSMHDRDHVLNPHATPYMQNSGIVSSISCANKYDVLAQTPAENKPMFIKPLQAIPNGFYRTPVYGSCIADTSWHNERRNYAKDKLTISSMFKEEETRIVVYTPPPKTENKKKQKRVSWIQGDIKSQHVFEQDLEPSIEESISNPRGKPTIKIFKYSKAYRMEGAKHVAWASKYFRDRVNFIDEMDQRQLEYWESNYV